MIPLRNSRLLVLVLLALGLGPLVRAQGSDADRTLEGIQKEFDQEQKALREIAQEAQDQEAVGALYQGFYRDVVPEFAERYAAVARERKGTDVALQAWVKALELAADAQLAPLGQEGLAAIVSDHIQSETLEGFSSSLRWAAQGLGEEAVTTALRTVAERSPHRKVQASARFNLGAVLGDERSADDPRLEQAKAVFASVKKDFSDLEYMDGRTYSMAAESFLFALENLLVGKPCPDFEARDAEGVDFKLSDYKGKVVLVDFWGFW